MTDGSTPGFFGKLPSRGDFVSRRLPGDFLAGWDPWLQRAIAASQAALGNQWLEVYLTSPIWRFALSPGVCGECGHLGVLIPSVDKVGRYFPLAAAVSYGSEIPVLATAIGLDGWYADLEELLLETLADAPLELETFDARLAGLQPRTAPASRTPPQAVGSGGARTNWHCAVPHSAGRGEALSWACSAALAEQLERYAVWWTQGSERVEPCVLIAADLPPPEACVAMLDGRFAERGWTSSALPSLERRSAARPSARARSAAVSDKGKVRTLNEDAFAVRDDVGAWLVADGLGGHQAGDTASRMVASTLAYADAAHGLRERTGELARSLEVVNGCLLTLAEHGRTAGLSASTVAALLIQDDRAAFVWAGDSRIYRLRGGELAQLSRDHSESGEPGHEHAVTRAVGGRDRLDLEIANGEVRPGDRYLLCTDGVHSAVGSAQLAAALALATPELACEEIKQTVLSGEARDNLTAIAVYVAVDTGEAAVR